ncbi:AAA family ATPase [bacterium]|nr:AAA family ATPase [bacterium]
MPIKEFVDQFYEKDEEGYRPLKEEVFTLGYKPLETKFGGASKNSSKKYFEKACWQRVQGVYRHKVNEIYEIEYLGGKIKTTGDHSVFVREHNMIVPKKVSELKPGEILVSLPFKVRSEFVKGKGTLHKIKSFQFPSEISLELDLYQEKYQKILKLFNFALQNRFVLTQKEIGKIIGVSQSTVKDWQIGRRKPKFFTLNVFRKEIPSKIKVTPKLMRLLGYFLAEGRCLPYGIEFVFGASEKELQKDCLKLMKEIFNLEGRVKESQDNTVRLSFFSKIVSEFFEKHCGTGSKNKHLPEFVWDLPKEYVLELLKGWIKGDGYQSKEKKLIGTSTSYQLILEFKWLLAMHGIKTGLRREITKGGRVIKNKPLPSTESWNLIIGKSANPFIEYKGPKAQYKKPYIKKITKLPYQGFVYDLCGCENEAFFGGENPILLHNSRVRDAFQTAKEAARKEGAAILFIDEIDAIGRERGAGLGGGHDEREQTLNQILVEMDGFEKEDRLIVMAASITGETPVMVKRKGKIEILPIKEVIDPYYQENEERIEKFVKDDLEVLGFEREKILFKKAAFKKVRSVYRHKVNEIYEVKYLGGKIRTTGNHSLFVRTKQGIQPKLVSQLKPGDILVDLPFKVNRSSKKFREIRAFEDFKEPNLELKVWQPLFDKNLEIQKAYEFALQSSLSQEKIGKKLGFSQTTISKWQRGVHLPRALSREYFKAKEILPEKVKVTKDLMRLFGYYVAEGYARKEIDFCVGKNEKEMIEDIKGLMKKIFNLAPDREREITEGAINLVYHAKPVAEFFKYWCGSGAQNKHLPWFLFELPQEYFLEFLKGWARGDGYFNKRGGLEITSVSKRLIIEANWLARMHGFKPFITKFVAKEGRKIKNGKPLKATVAYRLVFAKSQNPFGSFSQNSPTRLPKVISVKKIPYNGYVYDFCGCENEAFFAGESPVLAHNTNRPDILDPALLRPGRFDRRIVLDLPDLKGREEILKIHTRHIPLAKDVDLKVIAERTPGFSGADLENLVNEAAILAARKDKKVVGQEEFLAAIEKVLLGPERKSFLLSEKERKIAAYHEAGHAIVSAFTPSSSKVQKISIVARGKAAGYTLRLPEEEKHFKTKTEFLADLASLLGGYAAEKLVFGEITTGAANDLRDATDIARALVTKYGMSSLGPITFGKFSQPVFLGREIAVEKDYSDEVAAKIDRETKKFIDQAYKTAIKILKKHRKFLDKVAQILMEKETIEKEEFEKLVEEEKKKIKKE